jgi:four helix bundle protein
MEVSIREDSMQDFRNLEVWRRAHQLTLQIYKLTDGFPRSEMFGLSSQLRRAAASVATNLAEGCGRTQGEFGRFVQISFGSACEVEYELLLAKDLGLVPTSEYGVMSDELISIKRMLASLMNRLQIGLAASGRPKRANVKPATGMS